MSERWNKVQVVGPGYFMESCSVVYRKALIHAVLVALSAWMFYGCQAEEAPKPALSDEEFLSEIRTKDQERPEVSQEEGTLPSIDKAEKEEIVPIIELATQELDMGVISNKEKTSKELKIYNRGKAPLEIIQVVTTCGCVVATLKDSVIPPNGETVLEVTVDPFKIRRFDVKKVLRILSDDPINRTLQLAVLAKVDPEFSVTLDKVDFGEIRRGTSAEQTILLRQVGDEPLEVTGLKQVGQQPGLELSYEKRPEEEWAVPGKPEYLITVRLTPEADLGPHRAYFYIQTTYKRLSNFLTPVVAQVESFYKIAPKTLMFRTANPGQRHIAKAMITADQPFEVANLSVSSEEFEVTSGPGDEPNTVRVDLHMADTAAHGRKNAQVTFTVKTDEETSSESMRVFGYVRRPQEQ